MLAFLSAWRLYAAVGVVVLLLGVVGYGLFERQVALTAQTQVATEQQKTKSVTEQRDNALDQLSQSEAQNKNLEAENQKLDGLIVAQQKRAQELEHEKAQLWDQFDKLSKLVPKEDQDCLHRALPDAVVDFLRDDGPADSGSLPTNPGSPKPAPAVS